MDPLVVVLIFYTGATWFWRISRTTWTKSESSTVLHIATGIGIFYLNYQQGPTGAPGDPGVPGDAGTPVSCSIHCMYYKHQMRTNFKKCCHCEFGSHT